MALLSQVLTTDTIASSPLNFNQKQATILVQIDQIPVIRGESNPMVTNHRFRSH